MLRARSKGELTPEAVLERARQRAREVLEQSRGREAILSDADREEMRKEATAQVELYFSPDEYTGETVREDVARALDRDFTLTFGLGWGGTEQERNNLGRIIHDETTSGDLGLTRAEHLREGRR